MQNFNSKTNAIIDLLQDNNFQVSFEREGAAQKKHTLLGVVICYHDNASQAVCPSFNDLEFELNPIEIKNGRLVVSQKSLGKASTLGHKWFEIQTSEYPGTFPMYLSTEEAVAEAVYTPPPMPPEPPKVEVQVDVTIKNADKPADAA